MVEWQGYECEGFAEYAVNEELSENLQVTPRHEMEKRDQRGMGLLDYMEDGMNLKLPCAYPSFAALSLLLESDKKRFLFVISLSVLETN